MTVRRIVWAAVALVGCATAAPAADWKAAADRRDPPADLPAPVAKTLDRDAVTVTDGAGEPVLTVWFRTAVPVQATAEQVKNGLTYREIPDGTLVGAVRFVKPFVDYRKQDIAAGVYTLRFAVQPDIGDHQGTAPHPEFVLLTPAAKDPDPEPVEPKTLVARSAGATGGDHPGVVLLFPDSGTAAGPKLAEKGGVTVLSVRRSVDADGVKGALGFALTVAGHSKSR